MINQGKYVCKSNHNLINLMKAQHRFKKWTDWIKMHESTQGKNIYAPTAKIQISFSKSHRLCSCLIHSGISILVYCPSMMWFVLQLIRTNKVFNKICPMWCSHTMCHPRLWEWIYRNHYSDMTLNVQSECQMEVRSHSLHYQCCRKEWLRSPLLQRKKMVCKARKHAKDFSLIWMCKLLYIDHYFFNNYDNWACSYNAMEHSCVVNTSAK